jgi:hypothetical protein
LISKVLLVSAPANPGKIALTPGGLQKDYFDTLETADRCNLA